MLATYFFFILNATVFSLCLSFLPSSLPSFPPSSLPSIRNVLCSSEISQRDITQKNKYLSTWHITALLTCIHKLLYRWFLAKKKRYKITYAPCKRLVLFTIYVCTRGIENKLAVWSAAAWAAEMWYSLCFTIHICSTC